MLLDTNIVIYACQPGGGWLAPWTSDPDAAIASVTRIEALGFAGISPDEEAAILSFVNASPTYALDDEVIEQAIQLRQQKKMKLGDAIIAATALAYHIPLVTRNEEDFKHIPGLDLRNPFANIVEQRAKRGASSDLATIHAEVPDIPPVPSDEK